MTSSQEAKSEYRRAICAMLKATTLNKLKAISYFLEF